MISEAEVVDRQAHARDHVLAIAGEFRLAAHALSPDKKKAPPWRATP